MKLNHVLLRCSELAQMHHFLVDIIGLQVVSRPPFGFPGAWFGHDGEAIVHVAEDPAVLPGRGAVAHFAIEGADLALLLRRLREHNHPCQATRVPLTGELQVFVPGPDGVVVEMLFPIDAAERAMAI